MITCPECHKEAIRIWDFSVNKVFQCCGHCDYKEYIDDQRSEQIMIDFADRRYGRYANQKKEAHL